MKTKIICLLFTLLPIFAIGQVTVKNIETTNTQAILTYTAPDSNTCTLAVSQTNGSPVSNTLIDCDTTKFLNSNVDNRLGNISFGSFRQFLIGAKTSVAEDAVATKAVSSGNITRSANVATVTLTAHGYTTDDRITIAGTTSATNTFNGTFTITVLTANTFTYVSTGANESTTGAGTSQRVNYFSRALQANTLYYFTITCGGLTASGSFTTQNIPFGRTYGEPPQQISPGTQIFPTFQSVKGASAIDPLTGVLVKRVTANDFNGGYGNNNWYASGDIRKCDPIAVSGGYYCFFLTDQGFTPMYWVNASTGVATFLGMVHHPAGADFQSSYAAPLWDPSVVGRGWWIGQSTQTPAKAVVIRWDYTGDLTDKAVNSTTDAVETNTNLTLVSGNNTLEDKLVAFDATYSPTQYGLNCSGLGIQLTKLIFNCRRNQQDSPAWLGAFETSNSTLFTAFPSYSNSVTRWCGNHGNYYVGDAGVFDVVTQLLTGGTATGPYLSRLTASVVAGDTTFAVNGEPVASGAGIAPDGNPSLMNAATGDYFKFTDGTGEIVKISNKVSGINWSMTRAQGGTSAQSHANGASLEGYCSVWINGNTDFWWNFLSSNALTIETFLSGGHNSMRQNGASGMDVMEDANFRIGSFPSQINTIVTGSIQVTPAFAGVSNGFSDGNRYQKHPTFDQLGATVQEQAWWTDYFVFSSNGGSDVITAVPTTTYLYKDVLTTALSPKILPYFGMSGGTILWDISGPGSVLNDTTADNYKFCVVYKVDECKTGSAVGDVYLNLPLLTQFTCVGGELGTTNPDGCVQSTNIFGQAVEQFGSQETQVVALNTGANTGAPIYGVGKSRPLVKGLTSPYKKIGGYENAYPLFNGQWLLLPSRLPNLTFDNIYAAQVPPQPTSDSIIRNEFVPVTIHLTPPAALSVNNALIEFGYNSSFQCTVRQETCNAVSSTYSHSVSATSPFQFGTSDGTVNGVACSVNCDIVIPAISGKILYYRWKYRNVSNVILATSQTYILAVN